MPSAQKNSLNRPLQPHETVIEAIEDCVDRVAAHLDALQSHTVEFRASKRGRGKIGGATHYVITSSGDYSDIKAWIDELRALRIDGMSRSQAKAVRSLCERHQERFEKQKTMGTTTARIARLLRKPH